MTFTFAVISYNQEKFILDQLFSIKKIVELYGSDVDVHLLVCDDHSQDRTIFIVKGWLKENGYLFQDYKIIVQEKNVGIVKNIICAFENITTENFKLLAADDFYTPENIFEKHCNNEMILTPVVHLNTEGNVDIQDNYFYKEIYCLSPKKRRRVAQYRLKYQMEMTSPGIFFSKDYLTDELYSELNNYFWIEDIPLWKHILNKKRTKVQVIFKPYVIYRVGVGISQNSNHEKRKELEEDHKKIKKNIIVYSDKLKYHPYYYFYRLRRKVIVKNKKKEIDQIDKRLKDDIEKIIKHIEEIQISAKNFLENILPE